ncbi:unnamed protein product [Prorocentrum cordatum]|uniref:Uncharacterized protein n=1 Tax=Prorocentrum cordatum TaxID=2364126 RepID=A0ABN9Y892_9DINO|nr:unnamed protein product [Polarella glacialis]
MGQPDIDLSIDQEPVPKAHWCRMKAVIAAMFMVLVGAALGVGMTIMIMSLENEDVDCQTACPASTDSGSYTACWKPMLEINEYGFPFLQQHVATFLQNATDSMLAMSSLPPMGRVSPPAYDYAADAREVARVMSTIVTQAQKDEVKFFDSKLDVALAIIGTLLLGYGLPIEEIVLHSIGETSAVHDAGIAMWKSKLLHSRIRPTSVVQRLFPDETLTINDGVEILGKRFQALLRVMPHSEFPSGSSCMCQAIDEYITDLWPALSLHSMGAPVTFDAEVTHVVLPNPSMASVPLTGTANPAAEGYTSRTLNERCGESRLEGGMHFNASVPAGRELCSGIGAKAAQTTKLLAPLPAASSATLRSVIASTPPCAADCCADSAPCTQAEQAACASNCTGAWSLPWFDVVDVRVKAFGLPDREIATSTAAPFFQADRNHLVVVGLFGAVVPAIQRHETISFSSGSRTRLTIWFGIRLQQIRRHSWH